MPALTPAQRDLVVQAARSAWTRKRDLVAANRATPRPAPQTIASLEDAYSVALIAVRQLRSDLCLTVSDWDQIVREDAGVEAAVPDSAARAWGNVAQ